MATATAVPDTETTVAQAALDGYRTMFRMAVPVAESGPNEGERTVLRTRLRAAQQAFASPAEKAFLAAFLEVNMLIQERNTLRAKRAEQAAALEVAQQTTVATAADLLRLQEIVRVFVAQAQAQLPEPATSA